MSEFLQTDPYTWEKAYPPGLSWRDPLPQTFPLEGLLEFAAYTWPQRTAIDFYDRRISYAELWQLVGQAAAGLQELGIEPGSHVGLHLQNTPHFVIFFFGTLLAGGRVVNFNPLGGLTELEEQLRDSECRVLITGNWLARYAELGALKGVDNLENIIVCKLKDFMPTDQAERLARTPPQRSAGSYREIDFMRLMLNDGKVTRHPRGRLDDEVAALQYTGGTTGEPKGAMLTHANFSSVMNILGRIAAAQNRDTSALPPQLVPPQKVLAVLPLFHIFGLNSILLPSLAAGNEIVLHIRFDAGRVLADVTQKKINLFSAVPAMYVALANHPKFRDADFSSLLGMGSGGAPLPIELRRQFESGTDRPLAEGYALTETTGLGTMPIGPGEILRTGQVGLPVPHTLVEVVDLETGLEVLANGQVGEICFQGPQVMKGYWKKPEENLAVFRGGRFHTGDIGFLDPSGTVVLTERKKDMLLIGAHNVYPRNVERAIHEHPDVMEVTVIGIPNRDFGQVAKAFISLKPGSSQFTYRELCVFLTNRLASYEIPYAIEFRESLPKTAVGKLSKIELIQEEAARSAQSANAGASNP